MARPLIVGDRGTLEGGRSYCKHRKRSAPALEYSTPGCTIHGSTLALLAGSKANFDENGVFWSKTQFSVPLDPFLAILDPC